MKMETFMGKCIACNSTMGAQFLYEYCRCSNCGSWTYLSDRPAAVDNKEYFNRIFSKLGEFKIDQRKKDIFDLYRKKDALNRDEQYQRFHAHDKKMNIYFLKGKKVLEIGFGQGVKLIDFLEKGVDAYGVDISKTAVANLKKKYPQYRERVFELDAFQEEVEVIYTSALFEHLDDPRRFLEDNFSRLQPGGILILNAIPVLNEMNADLTPGDDISFWKPCHRVIYSPHSLISLLGNHGYELIDFSAKDDYNYRVLSLHNKKGYTDVTQLRNSTLEHDRLPGISVYEEICREALHIHSLALYGSFIFIKKN